jgi:hypothetical protein
LGFAAAKLRTEMARAPVLAHKLRYVGVTGFPRDPRASRQGQGKTDFAGDLPQPSRADRSPLSRAGERARRRSLGLEDRSSRLAPGHASAITGAGGARRF